MKIIALLASFQRCSVIVSLGAITWVLSTSSDPANILRTYCARPGPPLGTLVTVVKREGISSITVPWWAAAPGGVESREGHRTCLCEGIQDGFPD